MFKIKGIDVSKWQGHINWKVIKDDNEIQFAMLRSSFGYCPDSSQVDSFFNHNYNECKKHNIPCGCYHYSYARNKDMARKEAEYVLKYIDGKQFEFPIAYDIEEATILNHLTKSEITDIITTFCEILENAGYYVVIYSSKSYLEAFDKALYKKYDVWVAQWGVKQPTFSQPYGMWQYTSDGTVRGIQGRVDMNYAYKDYENIIKNGGFNGFSKSNKTETPKPEPERVTINGDGSLTLNQCEFYISSTARTPVKNSKGVKLLTGKYYLYDGKKHTNNRYRITNKKSNCGKKPIGQYVTGYVEVNI